MERLVRAVPGLRTLVREFVFLVRLVATVARADVVHVFACSYLYYYFHVLPAVLLTRLFQKRVVVNYRGGEAAYFFSGMAGFTVPLMRRADRVVVPSEYLREIFCRLGVAAQVIRNPVSMDGFAYREPRSVDGRRVRFICTRNFAVYYDVRTVVRAFAMVRGVLKEATLVLVGDGPLRGEVEKAIDDCGVRDAVSLRGTLDSRGVARELALADVFVNASRVDNYPVSILEAFATGVPVVTTAAGGIPRLVEHEVDALVVPVGDVEALGQGMLRLATDCELRCRLARNARAKADAHSWAHVGALWHELYNRLASHNPQRREATS